MPLPSSGAITAAMINVELGRASNAPFNLNDAAVRALAGKPTGPISFQDFYGKSNIPDVATSLNPSPDIFTGTPASGTVSLVIKSDGTYTTTCTHQGPVIRSGTWLNRGSASAYQVKITPTTGSFSANSAANWVPLSNNQEARVTRNTNGLSRCIYKVEIRRASDSVIVSTTSNIYMEYDRNPNT